MSKARYAAAAAWVALAGLAACSITGQRDAAPRAGGPGVPVPGASPKSAGPNNVPPPPADLLSIPDPVPKFEPRARNGNPPFYEVFGKRYRVMASSLGYVERGVASWYGPGFHAVRTAIGEPYDMYAMTAAHKTLSLPTYVRVTNLQNGRSVIVRVNDRGPFVGNRIIDLSYTAAAKLDMLRNGTAFVEVRAIDASANPIASITPLTSAILAGPNAGTTRTGGIEPATDGPAEANGRGFFIQAGAFGNPANAEKLATRLRSGHYGTVFIREAQKGDQRIFRVRIGPIADVATFDQTVKALELAGVNDAQLALD